jgi:transketolase N-terminal domain/subunit
MTTSHISAVIGIGIGIGIGIATAIAIDRVFYRVYGVYG